MQPVGLERVVEGFVKEFGVRPDVVAQTPGRINLMGRHVDHQGADVNMLALDRYVFMAVGRSRGSGLDCRNGDAAHYSSCRVDLGTLAVTLDDPWHPVIERPEVVAGRDRLPLWCRYVAGTALRLSVERNAFLPPLNVYVHGDLPPAAGLSSSSALSLGFVLAADALFGYDFPPEKRIELSSEGEHYTGIRGGTSDQAAMLACRPESIVHLGCLPFGVRGTHPFSRDYRIVLANSHESARKGENARNEYNWRVGAYRIAAVLLRRARPEWSERMDHLRDVYPERLGVPLAAIYEAMKDLPIVITRSELADRFPEEYRVLEPAFAAHTEPRGGYPIRDILLYGLAEMERSRQVCRLLDAGDYVGLGRWIELSHRGDRVSEAKWGQRVAWRPPVLRNPAIDRLVRAAAAGDPAAALVAQTGAYACSTFRVDEMVDLCLGVRGCLGAQILGAGLGGSMMALVEAAAAQDVTERLQNAYFRPRGLPPDVWTAFPGSGATVHRT